MSLKVGGERWRLILLEGTLPETNSSQLKMHGWNTVSFRCNC